LLYCGASHFIAGQEAGILAPLVATLASICGLSLLIGLFNWLACSLVALMSLGIVLGLMRVPMLNGSSAKVSAILTAVIAIALLCLGTGAYSIDARRHGRRELTIPARPHSSDDGPL